MTSARGVDAIEPRGENPGQGSSSHEHCDLQPYEAKTALSKLVDRAAAGEEIIIAKSGKPLARLTAFLIAREAIANADLVFVSAASAWEAAIEQALGRLEVPDAFEAGVADSGFEPLLASFVHAERAGALPLHHRDPFGRMLVAQAIEERLTLVSHDAVLALYDVAILPV